MAMSENALVHRDIKPQNIMLTRSGAKLLDFNIASRVGDPVRTVSGTPPYQAPDANLTRWDVSTDLFAVGVTLYELLCDGNHPYEQSRPTAGVEPRDPRQYRRDMNDGLAFLVRACAPDRSERFHALAGVFSSDAETASQPSTREIIAGAAPSTVRVLAKVDGSSASSGTGWVYDADRGLIVTNALVVTVPGPHLLPGRAHQLLVDAAAVDDRNRLGGEGVASGSLGCGRRPRLEAIPEPDPDRAAINHGNSGGPLVDGNGNLVGINSLTTLETQGQGFAIGVDLLKEQAKTLEQGDSIGFLGFDFVAGGKGLLVNNAVEGSPAADAGFGKQRVLVMAVDGESVPTRAAYCRAVDGAKSGQTATVSGVTRSGRFSVELPFS